MAGWHSMPTQTKSSLCGAEVDHLLMLPRDARRLLWLACVAMGTFREDTLRAVVVHNSRLTPDSAYLGAFL